MASDPDEEVVFIYAPALHLAVESGSEQAVLALLDQGDSPNSQDEGGDAPIHIAAELGHEGILSLLLLRGADVNMVSTQDGSSPLMLAATIGHLSVTKALLAAGADVNLRDAGGWSALDKAASEGYVDVMREILQHGVDVMSRGPDSLTTLHIAAQYNQAGAVDVLVEASADVEAREEEYDSTPLHLTALYGSRDAMFALLRHGADVHAQDVSRSRPLHEACSRLHQEAAALLLRWGADETSENKHGECASQVAGDRVSDKEGRHGDIESMRRLLERANAWRRRGLLVLCRSFTNKDRLGVASIRDIGGSMEQPDSVSSRTRAGKRRKTQKSAGHNVLHGVADGAETATTSREGTSGSLFNVEARVIGLKQDELFRHIVSFL